MTDILTFDIVTHPKENISDLREQYRQMPKILPDKHAPIKSKLVSQKPLAPWMTQDFIQSKRRRRSLQRVLGKYLERVWGKSRSSLDRSRDSRQCHQSNREMAKAISDYYENMVSNNTATPQQLWKGINHILHRWPLLVYQLVHQSSRCATLFLVI